MLLLHAFKVLDLVLDVSDDRHQSADFLLKLFDVQVFLILQSLLHFIDAVHVRLDADWDWKIGGRALHNF